MMPIIWHLWTHSSLSTAHTGWWAWRLDVELLHGSLDRPGELFGELEARECRIYDANIKHVTDLDRRFAHGLRNLCSSREHVRYTKTAELRRPHLAEGRRHDVGHVVALFPLAPVLDLVRVVEARRHAHANVDGLPVAQFHV